MLKFITIFCIIFSLQTYAAEEKSQLQGAPLLYANMLFAEDVKARTTGVKSIYRDEVFDTETLDLLAQLLYESYNDPETRAVQADLISWICKTLGKSGNMRYKSAVKEITKSDNRKIQRYSTASLQLFAGRKVPSYKPKNGLIKKLSAKYQLITENKPNKEQQFFSLKPGDNLDTIIKKLGMPNSTGSERSKSFTIGRRFRVSVSGMVLNYEGLGTLYLNYRMRNQTGWTIDIVSNIFYLMKDEENHRSIVIADYILGDNWVEATTVLRRNTSKRNQYSERLYDIAAEKLYRAMNTHNRYEILMLTHLAAFMRASAGPRYSDIMEHIAENSDSRYIRRHAKKAFKTFRKKGKKLEMKVKPYIAGSLDIGKYSYR